MGRIRSIHPKIWTDEGFITLSIKARLLLIALGTFADYGDKFEWDQSAMETHCGWAWGLEELCELIDAGYVTETEGVGEIHFAFGFPRRRISKWEGLRSLVFARDGYACQYCGSRARPFHCDHIMPVSRGGSDDLTNLTTACAPCNLSKGDQTPEEWRGSAEVPFS